MIVPTNLKEFNQRTFADEPNLEDTKDRKSVV